MPGQYIVVFEESVRDVAGEVEARERAGGFRSRFRYGRALKGFAARLSERQVARLRQDREVAFVSPDRVVRAAAWTPLVAGEPVPPTGVRRIEAASTTHVRQPSGVGVAVIDTGIDLAHPDLDAAAGTNCVDAGDQPQDDHGHGTHVAGSIAARNNGAGVAGVAPGTPVYAVKVLDADGTGTDSQVICGIDWVTANAGALGIKVANMSLGGIGPPVAPCATTTDPEHKAICNSTAAGVTYVVAAGNSGWEFDHATDPDTPAAYPEVLTVTAASDSDGVPGASGGAPACAPGEADDRYAAFSNFAATAAGQSHTIAGPGVCILSTWPGGGYDTISGTSMATPHVAGAVALCLSEGSTAGPCSELSPAQIVQHMRTVAQNRTAAAPEYGFDGDPTRPVSGKYFGYLSWVAPEIVVSPSALPGAITGRAYAQTLTSDGGSSPYAYAVSSGSLPPGLTLSSSGSLAGTPDAVGAWTFTVIATDTNGATGRRAYSLSVGQLSIAPSALANGVVGAEYGPVDLTANGGTGPYSFSVSQGSLPPGLSLAATGRLSGTPSQSGGYTFAIRATDTADGGFGSRTYSVNVSTPTASSTTSAAPATSTAPGTSTALVAPVSLVPFVDRLRPTLALLRLSTRVFRAARRGPSARTAAPVGTRVSWRLSEPARVTFRVQRATAGRRVGRQCVRPTRANRARTRCTRYVLVRGSFSRAGTRGANAIRFTGRIGGRALAPARYRLLASARDRAGNRAPLRRVGFRIVRR